MFDHSITAENRHIFFEGDYKASLVLDQHRRAALSKWLKKYICQETGSVLDIGCWNGDFLNLLPDTWEKTGRDLVRHPGLPKHIKFKEGNAAESLPFLDDSFDLLFAGEIIEHLLNTSKFLQDCYRILKTGGFLMLATPNPACFANLRQWFVCDQLWCVDNDAGQNGHVRYFTPKTLAKMLTKIGFEAIEWNSRGGMEFLRKSPWIVLYKLLFALFPMRGKCLMCVARK